MTKYQKLTKVCVRDDPDVSELSLDRQLEYIRDDESLVRFECRTDGCHFATDNSNKLFNHEQICRSETEIICKQVALHRPDETIRNELIAENILPPEWRNWNFATFDVECFMEKVQSYTGPQSIHRLVTISLKTTFGNPSTFYFQRENMKPLSVRRLIQDFVSKLVYLRKEMFKTIPDTVIEGQKHYSKIIQSKDFKNRSVEKQAKVRAKLHYLDDCLSLKIYSWNGERYDHNVVWAPILDVMSSLEDDFRHLSIIRRGTGIMQFSDGGLIFRDFMNMTSPMSLDDFVKSCRVPDGSKTTFPYEHFSTIEELEKATEFPAYAKFRSSLCKTTAGFIDELEKLVNKNLQSGFWTSGEEASSYFGFEPSINFACTAGEYKITAADVDRISAMMSCSPIKYFDSKEIFKTECKTMADYLRIYNLNDVIILEKCVTAYAKGFYNDWGVNIHDKMSLPGVAQDLAFRYYDANATAIYSFSKNFTDYNREIRKNLLGGMTLVTGLYHLKQEIIRIFYLHYKSPSSASSPYFYRSRVRRLSSRCPICEKWKKISSG